MNTIFLSNILASLVPDNDGFVIRNQVNNEQEYDSYVEFNTSSEKPSWTDVNGKIDDQQWVEVRASRNFRLSQSDWVMISDVPMSEERRTQWQTYRQALRDITTLPDPFNINWPTPPE
jgi:hypothetical protein